jgi:hypothetical protein
MHARLELFPTDEGGRLPQDQPMMMPGTGVEVDLEPVDAGRWLQVSTSLVLGVFEGDHQVGTTTVLSL